MGFEINAKVVGWHMWIVRPCLSRQLTRVAVWIDTEFLWMNLLCALSPLHSHNMPQSISVYSNILRMNESFNAHTWTENRENSFPCIWCAIIKWWFSLCKIYSLDCGICRIISLSNGEIEWMFNNDCYLHLKILLHRRAESGIPWMFMHTSASEVWTSNSSVSGSGMKSNWQNIFIH